MSVAESFSTLNEFFPFCRDQVTDGPDDPSWDVIPLNTDPADPDDQPGLTEAMRIWWNIENIRIDPHVLFIGSPGDHTAYIQGVYSAVLPDQTNLIFYSTSGSIVAEYFSLDDPNVPATMPSNRICYNTGDFVGSQLAFADFTEEHDFESGTIILYIGWDGDRWNLYYYFSFGVSIGDFGDAGYMFNLASKSPGPRDVTGTFAVVGLGYEFDYVAEPANLDWAVGDAQPTSIATFFTYPE